MTQFAFLSTYPPTRCGLATFTEALAAAMVAPTDPVAHIVRALDAAEQRPQTVVGARSIVRADLIAGDRASMATTIRTLNAADVVVMQHEYGIYGGTDGDEVVDVLRSIATPTIVVLHTVLVSPSDHQRTVLNAVCDLADSVVVMTENARAVLLTRYTVAAVKVRVIPHGVAKTFGEPHRAKTGRKSILTWGLISPGKGIEWGIRAIARLKSMEVQADYTIAGQTHPKVLAHAGEDYRHMLTDLVAELEVQDSVTLDSRYRDAPQLAALIGAADVVLLPYDSRDQVTSGVLAEAVAAGVPVVATGFPHAVELLSGGAGIIAAHEDPASMAEALRTILTASDVAERMHLAALRDAHETSWPQVAAQYRAIAAVLVAARAA